MSKSKSMWNRGVELLLNTHDNHNLSILLNEIMLLALNRFNVLTFLMVWKVDI